MFHGRAIRIAIWVLAVILPGGLALLALWATIRAVRTRSARATSANAQVPNGQLLRVPSQPVRT